MQQHLRTVKMYYITFFFLCLYTLYRRPRDQKNPQPSIANLLQEMQTAWQQCSSTSLAQYREEDRFFLNFLYVDQSFAPHLRGTLAGGIHVSPPVERLCIHRYRTPDEQDSAAHYRQYRPVTCSPAAGQSHAQFWSLQKKAKTQKKKIYSLLGHHQNKHVQGVIVTFKTQEPIRIRLIQCDRF